jgi:hypothetical protein
MSKKYTTNFLEDTNGSTGSANQVLISTAAGIDWVDGSGSAIIGGPYLPLVAGSGNPLTGDLYINDDVPSIILNDTNATSPTNTAAYISFRSQGTQQGYIGYGSSSNNDIALYGASGSDAVIYSGAGLALTLDTSQNATFAGDVTVSGGDITLGGATGRIQGIDTINAGTDAVNRNYVDTEIGNIPSGLAFEGNWNASTDTPTLAGTTQDNGKFWIVSVAGSTNLSGITDWAVGDWAIYVDNGAGTDAWQKVDNSSTLSGLGAANKVAFWSTTSNVSFNNNFSYDGTNLTAPRLRVGDGTDGYFYSDSAGRTAFTGGDFYIQSNVSNAYNYATNNYHGSTSGDNQLFRGNPLSGNNWNITAAGAATFTTVTGTNGTFSGTVTGGVSTSNVDGQANIPFKLGVDYNSYMVAAAGNTWGLFWAGNSGARYGTNGNGGPGNIWGNSGNPNEFAFVGGDSTAWTVYGTNGNVWQKGDLWVNGGDIILGGTGRIQGVDTVSASTDAANKAYVDGLANDDITALAFSGTTTQTLTATQRDSSTLTASFNISKIKAGGNGPSTENLNSVADSVSVGQLEYRGFNSSSTNKPPTSDNANGVITVGQHAGNYNAQLAFSSNGNMYWRDNPSTGYGSWRTMWDSDNDGAGSGLDADLLDGLQATSFLRSDATDTSTGEILFDAGFTSDSILLSGTQNFDNISRSGFYNLYNTSTGSTNPPPLTFGTMIVVGGNKQNNSFGFQMANERLGNGLYIRGMNDSASAWSSWAEVWTSTTDGSGSGLNADLLDGYHASTTRASANTIPIRDGNGYLNLGWINTTSGNTTNTISDVYVNTNDGYIRKATKSHFRSQLTDGVYLPIAGTAADSNLLDGKDHTNFGATLATYGTTAGASGRIRITAPFNTNSGHMFQVTVSIYSGYTIHTYVVGGYMYNSTNNWYLPKAVYSGTGTPDIKVGRDSNGKAYISIANGNYTGVRVHNMTLGYYTNIADTYDPWTITIDAALPNVMSPNIYTTWTSGNDGAGSGLDADLLDGQQGSYYASAASLGNYVTIATNQTITGDKTFSDGPYYTGTTYWRVSSADAALQRADARDDSTNYSRLHWYGESDTGATSNFRHAYYDGSNYINVTAASGRLTFSGKVAGSTPTAAGDLTTKAYVDAATSGIVTGTGLTNQVAVWTNTANIIDGPITFSSNDAAFAGKISVQGSNVIEIDQGTSSFNHISVLSTFGSKLFSATNYGYVLESSSTAANPVTFRFDNDRYRIYSGSSGEALTVLANKKVGINNSAPGYQLDVTGNARFTETTRHNGGLYTSSTQTRNKISVWSSLSTYTIGMKNGFGYGGLGGDGTGTDYAMSFQMSNSNNRGWWWGDSSHSDLQGSMSLTTQGKLVVATSIKVGAGESTGSAGTSKLTVVTPLGGIGADFQITGGSGYGTKNVRVAIPAYGDGIQLTSFAASSLDNNAITFYQDANKRGSIVVNATSTSYNTTSDYRLKENKEIISDAIERVKALKPVKFNWISEPSQPKIDGFYAHELAEVVPEAVTGEKDALDHENNPDYQSIDQSKIVPLLSAALQQAIDKIEELEQRIQLIENK